MRSMCVACVFLCVQKKTNDSINLPFVDDKHVPCASYHFYALVRLHSSSCTLFSTPLCHCSLPFVSHPSADRHGLDFAHRWADSSTMYHDDTAMKFVENSGNLMGIIACCNIMRRQPERQPEWNKILRSIVLLWGVFNVDAHQFITAVAQWNCMPKDSTHIAHIHFRYFNDVFRFFFCSPDVIENDQRKRMGKCYYFQLCLVYGVKWEMNTKEWHVVVSYRQHVKCREKLLPIFSLNHERLVGRRCSTYVRLIVFTKYPRKNRVEHTIFPLLFVSMSRFFLLPPRAFWMTHESYECFPNHKMSK